jgi:hypothetical protein
MKWRNLRVRLRPPWEHTYRDVFVAIVDGRNRKAAQLLRGLSADHLDELVVICGDVQQMVTAAQRSRKARLAATDPPPPGSRATEHPH